MGDGQSAVPGLSADDISPTIYEGGFKTWECAVDLANYLLRNDPILDGMGHDLHIIEVKLPMVPVSTRRLAQSNKVQARCRDRTSYNVNFPAMASAVSPSHSM